MTNITKKITTTTEKTTKFSLTRVDILGLLDNAGLIPEYDGNSTIKVYFHVPGGGDYSNEDVDVEDDYPVYVEFTSTHTDEK